MPRRKYGRQPRVSQKGGVPKNVYQGKIRSKRKEAVASKQKRKKEEKLRKEV